MEIKFYNEKGDKNYTISSLRSISTDIEEKYWLKNEDGEGMTTSNSLIFELIDEFFKKNF